MHSGNSQLVESLLNSATQRADQILRKKSSASTKGTLSISTQTTANTKQESPQPIHNYGKNPAITTTALAHLLWSHVLQDATHTAVIDATAGNGNDAVFLAQLLFPNLSNDTAQVSTNQLLCLDVQERACQVTEQRLADLLPQSILQNNVQVLQQSHATFPDSQGPVSLVVYNLGYLPNSTHLEGDDAPDKNIKTNTQSTLNSLMNAATLLQVGGMLSIMTYPRSDAVEDAAVHAFCQGLALFSSQTQDWRGMFTENDNKNHPDLALSPLIDRTVKQQIYFNLEKVLHALGSKSAWRVQEYKKMGWIDSPILVTAFRIK
ncbi:hypothetical protein FisN_3Lh041 [Fistulifera solaris]|uniref:Uncharacterized protein n=1 Tax=Fistulifera solaris TaxID=1519565 RepID=A0A1Z5JYZ8_FISSO|nr:hypothetical protein FisN_3Lh041 [Fistulifera solaris]|eukprot:GAX19102.1 hypothetical protein FisN_3Lh041 [Fistulifera solaris]